MANQNFKDKYKYGFSDGDISVFKTEKGHSVQVIQQISKLKNEPDWMLEIRLNAYKHFLELEMPDFGPDLSEIDFDDIWYYVKPTNNVAKTWGEIPSKIRNTFDKLGISEDEQQWLGGIATQYDSEMIYSNELEKLKEKGILFGSTDDAVAKHPEIVQKYFGSLVHSDDNKFAALNTAFWSGGTFLFIPKDMHLERPIQSYFRINARGSGQFERTLIILEDNASAHYIEGCTAPTYTVDSLHAAVVEVFVGKNSSCRYTTIQNWSDNVINLVTKRAITEENASMEWVDGNLGSKINMKYPSTILKGDNSRASTLSIAVAIGKDLIQDAGSKMIHIGKNTSSTVVSKSVSGLGGRVNYRGTLKQLESATGSHSKIECDTMILDDFSKSDTIPKNMLLNNSSFIEHEAVVSKISEDQIFYLQTKGLSEDQARELIIMGFLEPFAKEIPLEYASELNALIRTQLESNIG